MTLAGRIQSYLRETARQQYESVAVPPFTAFFHPRDLLTYLNYAIPDAPVFGSQASALAELRARFRTRGRRPRFEFIEEYAPDLSPALRAAGFAEEACMALMVCEPHDWRPPPEVHGLRLDVLDATAPLEGIKRNLSVNDRGFSESASGLFSDEDAERFRGQLVTGRAITAWLGDAAVGAGAFNPPRAGLAELVGITTLTPYRRRGVATALTAQLAREAFAAGVDVAFLTAADEGAGRVYERIGFRRAATMLAYVEPIGVPG